MLEEMYEWYIFALDVDDEDAQGGRLALASIVSSVEDANRSTSNRSGGLDSSELTFDERMILRQRYLPGYSTGSNPGGKARIGFQGLNFGLNVARVVFVWLPGAAGVITAAKRGTYLWQASLDEDEGGFRE